MKQIHNVSPVQAKRLETRSLWLAIWTLTIIFLAALIVFPNRSAAQTVQIAIGDGYVSRIEMAPGTTLNVETDGTFADIVIGNPDIIDVFPLTEMSVYLQSKQIGVTNITLYDENKNLLEVIDIRVRTDFTEVQRLINTAVPSAQVTVGNVNNRIRLSGEVKDNVDMARVLEIASQFSSEPIINGVSIQSPQQVELDVRILEVQRSSGRSLGVDLTGTRNGSEVFSTSGAGSSGDAPFGNAVGELLEISGVQVDFVINAMESRGLARRLANPKLVTTSGIEANFTVGGSVPFTVGNPNSDGGTSFSTQFQEYGVRLTFTPFVLDDSLIRLKIAPEVSDIDESVDVNGQPGFVTRRAETTVSLRDGQSFAIAGLLQANNARGSDQVPWLGQVPVLGTLFSSRDFQKRETDLVILVTPRLVQPVGPNTPLVSPLDETVPSNDVELFLLGMLEVDRQLLNRFRQGVGAPGPYGHIIDLEFEDGVIDK